MRVTLRARCARASWSSRAFTTAGSPATPAGHSSGGQPSDPVNGSANGQGTVTSSSQIGNSADIADTGNVCVSG